MFHCFIFFFEIFFKGHVELSDNFLPFEFSLGNFVQFLFHLSGKLDIYYFWKMFHQNIIYFFPYFGRLESFLFVSNDVISFLDDGDNGGIGRGAADAQLFQFFDERSIVVSGWRLGKVLGRNHLFQSYFFTFFYRGNFFFFEFRRPDF